MQCIYLDERQSGISCVAQVRAKAGFSYYKPNKKEIEDLCKTGFQQCPRYERARRYQI
jgi:hypothetical protein